MKRDLHEANRLSWNAATIAHNSHKGDQAAFFREGGCTLFPEELDLLGEVEGRSLLHLQCNAGQDSISLARRGARVTGVDISDEAVAFARQLAAAVPATAAFDRADVYDWLTEAAAEGRQFDRVFSSYGAICWLSDLAAWVKGIAAVLKPGGRLVLVDFHPAGMCFDEQWQLHYDYFNAAAITEAAGVGDYVGDSGDGLALGGFQEGIRDFRNPHPSHEFYWGIGQIVTALSTAGLGIDRLEEYPYLNGWRRSPDMRDIGGRRMAQPEGMPSLPLMYGIRASKPA